jgi:hypothetical protein
MVLVNPTYRIKAFVPEWKAGKGARWKNGRVTIIIFSVARILPTDLKICPELFSHCSWLPIWCACVAKVAPVTLAIRSTAVLSSFTWWTYEHWRGEQVFHGASFPLRCRRCCEFCRHSTRATNSLAWNLQVSCCFAGDVVICVRPVDPSEYIIKRVSALAGMQMAWYTAVSWVKSCRWLQVVVCRKVGVGAYATSSNGNAPCAIRSSVFAVHVHPCTDWTLQVGSWVIRQEL